MKSQGTIIVTDDNEAGRYTLVRCLRLDGHDVLEAATGEECLKLVATKSPELVILDIRLPDLSGIEVCRKIKDDPETAHIPIIQTSAFFTATEDRSAGLESGADVFLPAPFDPRELLTHVRTLLRAHRAEQAQRESEQGFRVLFENNPDALLSVNLEGTILLANRACEAVTGYSAEELFRKNLKDLCAPEQRKDTLQDLYSAARESRTLRFETKWIRKDGRAVDLLLTMTPVVKRGQANTIYCTAKDITERKRVEQELELKNSQLLAVFEHSNAGLVLFDAQPPYRVLAVNRFYEQLWPEPWPSRGLLGAALTDYAPGLEESGIAQVFRDVVQKAQGRSMTNTPYDHMVGGRRWWNWTLEPVIRNGQVVALAHLAVDVTAEVQARERIQAQKNQLEAIYETMAEGLTVFDMAGNVVLVNGAVARFCGYSSAAEMKRNLPSLAHVFELANLDGSPVPAELWPVARVLRGESVANLELRVRRRDTGQEWILCYSGEPVRDAHGCQILAVVTSRDITEQKRAAEALQRSEERFRKIFEHAATGIAITDWEGRIIQCNPAYGAAVGYTQQELRGMVFSDLVHPDDLEGNLAQIRQLTAGEVPFFETEIRHVHKNGSLLWVHKYVSILRDEAGAPAGLLALLTDVTERRRAEEALRESEERFRAMADGLPLIVWVHDAEGRQQFVNRTFCEFFGVSPEQMCGEEWQVLMHPEDAPAYAGQFFASLREHRAFHAEARVKNSAGQWRWIESWGRPRFSSSGRFLGFVGTSADITDRKKAEEVLRESEEQLRVTLSAGRMGTWRWDIERGTVTTDALHRLLWDIEGDQEQVGVEVIYGRIHPEDLPRVITPERVGEINGHFELEFRVIRRDGEVSWLRSYAAPLRGPKGRVTKLVGVNFDVTEQKRAEESLRRSEERLRLAKSAGQIGIHDYNPLTGEILWDERVRELWCIGPEVPINYAVFISGIHPDDRSATEAEVQRALAPTGDGRYYAEYRVQLQGRMRWIAATGQATFQDGRAIRLIGTVQDITQRKEFQAELERLVAERTAKLQEMIHELEQYSYSISHDMRAPLRAMNQYSQIVLAEYGPCIPTEGQFYLQRISSAATRLDRLISDVLTYHRLMRADMPLETVDLDSLSRDIVHQYPMIQASQAEIHIASPLLPVRGNVAALTQCLSNLLGNAVKFVAPGVIPKVRIWTEPLGQVVRVWIEDNGIGVRPDQLDRIWGIFHQVHDSKSYEGTGIGLSIVKKAVERMGGKVGVESEPGQGSRFWLELPPPSINEEAGCVPDR